MTIQQALLWAITKLSNSKSTSTHLDAEVLLGFALKKSKNYLFAHPEKNITENQKNKFKKIINKRHKGVPVSYLSNHKEFYGLDFYIDRNVLVPRPETEQLIEETLRSAREQYSANKRKVVIADVGTGSGCIAIALAKYLPEVKIYATDISPQAILVAQRNARQHKVIKKISFKQGDLLKPLSRSLKKNPLDIISANLPYGTKEEYQNVKHEPRIAIDGGRGIF